MYKLQITMYNVQCTEYKKDEELYRLYHGDTITAIFIIVQGV